MSAHPRPFDPPASVDAVVPVHNEQGALAASIRRLQDYLSIAVPFAWRISHRGQREHE
jgi:hypothetical protein